MNPTLAEGVDPGLVHTGVVSVLFVPSIKKIYVRHTAILGPDARATANWLRAQRPGMAPAARTYVEAYRPRKHFGTDKRMVEAMAEFRKELPRSKQLDNTGIKKVVKTELLKLLGLWKFNTPTHHGDIRSAARIMVLGLLKDDEGNTLLADIVLDHLFNQETWYVEHH